MLLHAYSINNITSNKWTTKLKRAALVRSVYIYLFICLFSCIITLITIACRGCCLNTCHVSGTSFWVCFWTQVSDTSSVAENLGHLAWSLLLSALVPIGCLGGAVVRRRTCDLKVAGSTPSRGAIMSTRSTQSSIPPG